MSIPAEFKVLETQSPHVVNVGPIYATLRGDHAVFGLDVQQHHCNTAGRLSGGLICTVADIAIGRNVWMALERADYSASQNSNQNQIKNKRADGPRLSTVSLSTDFVGSAVIGDWVEIDVDVQKAGRTLAFANAYFSNKSQTEGDDRIARVSAVFRVLGTPG